jgi:hypothetical protein
MKHEQTRMILWLLWISIVARVERPDVEQRGNESVLVEIHVQCTMQFLYTLNNKRKDCIR